MSLDAQSTQQIYHAQVKAIYEHIPISVLIASAVSSMVVVAVWNDEHAFVLLGWLLANFVYFGWRLHSLKAFKTMNNKIESLDSKWERVSLYQTCIYGLLWGVLPLVHSEPEWVSQSGLLAIYFFAITAMIGLTVSHYSFLTMWFAFVVPTSVAIIWLLFTSAVEGTSMMAFFLLLFNLFLFSMMGRNKKSLRENTLLKNEYAFLMTQLQGEKEKSERATVNKSKFLAAASHDLRQPVHAMNLFIEMLQKQPLPEDSMDLVKRIRNSASNLQSLFNSLLDISRLDSDVIAINLVDVSIKEIVNDLIDIHRPEAKSKGLTIESKCDCIFVNTDIVLLKRILGNLLNNAIRYTDNGKITVHASTKNEQVYLSVTDTGKGISQENLAKVFDEFTQLDNPERDRNKGLGLGLAICRRLAELLETSIDVSSTLGQGSSFTIRLPMSVGNMSLRNGFSGHEQSTQSNVDLNDYSILVVDDERDILDAMPMILSAWGDADIRTASDDTEVQNALVSGFIPDLVISDFRLRNHLTGLDVIALVSEHIGYPVRSIIITGETGQDVLTELYKSDHKVLHKPIDMAQLEIAIVEALL